jgi:hypothetical protein
MRHNKRVHARKNGGKLGTVAYFRNEKYVTVPGLLFGGADLYACDPSIVVESVSGAAQEAWLRMRKGQN